MNVFDKALRNQVGNLQVYKIHCDRTKEIYIKI